MEEPVGQISPYAYLFSAAFMVWMLVDAWKRRAPLHWYVIIVVMMPIGAVVYFVMMKLRDYRPPTANPSSGFSVPTTDVPRVSNLDLADAMEDDGRYAEAEPIYRAALASDPNDRRALHGLGRCLAGMGNAKDALVYFEQLMEVDRAFCNYGAALDYADALWAADQKTDTIELLERLAEVTGRINHRLALGHYLAEFGQITRAKREVELALSDATGPNAPDNERHRRWVLQGQEMLNELRERVSEAPDGSD